MAYEHFSEIVNSRRSVRVFSDEAVPKASIDRALDLSVLAPNSSNLQPWEFWCVRDPVKKARLVEACLKQAAARTAAELVVAVARTDTWDRNRAAMVAHLDELNRQRIAVPERVQKYYRVDVRLAYRAWFPWTLIKWLYFRGTALLKPSVLEPIGRRDLRVWSIKSTALACENFMLAMHAQGYDTCPMEGVDSRRIQKLLGLPRCHSYICMVIGVGKAKDVDYSRGAPLPRFRVPREWIVREV